MPEMMTYRYHATECREGRKFTVSEAAALGADWVDTPDAFDPNWKRPAPAAARVPQRVDGTGAQVYPTYRYHPVLFPLGLKVASAEDEPVGEGWVDTPDKFPKADAAKPATSPAPKGKGDDDKPITIPGRKDDDPEPTADDLAMMEHWATPAYVLIEVIKGSPESPAPDKATLERMLAWENKRENVRVTVVAAINAALGVEG